MPDKSKRKPLPKGFIDPLDTSRVWKPQDVNEIFGSKGDVFGKAKKTVKPEDNEITDDTEEAETP